MPEPEPELFMFPDLASLLGRARELDSTIALLEGAVPCSITDPTTFENGATMGLLAIAEVMGAPIDMLIELRRMQRAQGL